MANINAVLTPPLHRAALRRAAKLLDELRDEYERQLARVPDGATYFEGFRHERDLVWR